MLLAHRARVHWDGRQRVADEETGPLIEADHRMGGIVGQRIQCQDLFHARQKEGIEGANAPGLR